MHPLLRSAQLGVAAGLRSMTAPAQLSRHLAMAPPAGPAPPLVGLLSRDAVRHLLGAAALGEMVADKLPVLPARTEPAPLFGRALFGALTGGVLARVHGEGAMLGAVVGATAAVAGAYAGYHARRALVHGMGLPDFPVAIGEDVLALALAREAVR